tara:strand:- start:287 stop:1696 length:1410 start_codon:yes stop_codon:yes gene_type:complete
MSHTNLITINSTEINNIGAFRVGDDLTSGTAGQVLKSQGPEQAPQWDNDTDTQLNLTAALPVVINNGGGLNREVALDIDTATMGISGGELEVLKVPNALTFTGTSTGTYDGSSALSINLTDTDTQLNLTAALPVIINNGGGLNREVELQYDSNTLGAGGGALEVLKVPNTLTFTGTATGTYDGSSALSINLTDSDTTYQGSSTININTATNPDTINCLKVPNVMTASTNIIFTNTDDGASATTYDGSEPITITAASSGTTYQGGTNINIDTSTTPDEINLDTSITGQTGITFLNSGASTNLTGSNYPGKPTTATNLDLTSSTNKIPSSSLGTKIQRTAYFKSFTTAYGEYSSNFRMSFVALSDNVLVEFRAIIRADNRVFYGGLYDYNAGSYIADSRNRFNYNDESDQDHTTISWWMRNLTAGTTYYISPYFRGSSSSVYIYAGHTGATDGFAPAIFRVIDGGPNVDIY